MAQQSKKSPVTSTQKLDKPKDQTQSKQQQVISIPMSELLKWDKKSKQLSNQIKVLTTENQSLKNEISELKKKQDDKRKKDNAVQGLQQTVKQLQKILEQNMTNLNKFKRQNGKLQDELNLTTQTLNSRESELVSLRNTSSDYFLLKQQVNRLQNQVTNLKSGQSQISSLKQQLQQCKQKIDKNNQKITQLSLKNNLNSQKIQELMKQKNELQSSVSILKQQLTTYQKQRQQFDKRVKQYEMQIDDLQRQNQLALVKYVQQIKDLKQLLTQQKRLKEQYQSKVDDQQQQEINRRDETLEDKDTQYLLTKIEQLQTQNAVTKYMMNETSGKIALLQEKFKMRTDALVGLVQQYSQRWPNFEESQGLQYVQKQILKQTIQNKGELVDTIQRCVIQNLRLKHMIQTIGSQYNDSLRKKQQS